MTKRIQKIVELMPECDTLLDVGCDHGYIPLLALFAGKCKNIIISDISRPSLKKAETLLDGRGVSYKSYCTDGIRKITDDYDLLSICGMGGHEILSIIAHSPHKRLIIQPMKNTDYVRVQLASMGYRIITDQVVLSEGKFYDIIYCEHTGEVLDIPRQFVAFGRGDMSQPDFKSYIEYTHRKIIALLNENLPESRKEELRERLQLIDENYL